MAGWLKRFGLHLAAAIGATGIFVAAAAVGASQNHPAQTPPATTLTAPARPRTPLVPRRTAAPAPTPGAAAPARAATAEPVLPERSLAGTVQDVEPDTLVVLGVGGRTWRVQPAPGALIRLNGKAARLDALAPGDTVVILGQAQRGPGARFVAH